MKTLTPIALSVSLLFTVQAVQAQSDALQNQPGMDGGIAMGMDMMLLNSSLLRNGDNMWQRVREGFQLPEVNEDLVRRNERMYAAKPEYFKRILDRSHKYLFYIMNEVEKRGMPTEIALLPVVESAFNPTAKSNVGASGLWQFMPTTGRQYGLEQTWWYDGRRDVLEATRAALDYLQNLYVMFGDWSLALAAYNWGEGNLSRSIARTRARGETETYENIAMPNETRNYVPKLVAVRNILSDPSKYGIHLDHFPNKPYFVTVQTGKHIDMDIAAKLAETPLREFKELNPAYNLPVAAYKNGRQILIPADKLSRFERNMARWDKPLLNWQVITPTSGDSVQSIATRYEMSPSELMSANHLGSFSLAPGRPLLVSLHKDSQPSLQGSPINDIDTSTPLLASVSTTGLAGISPSMAAPTATSTTPAILTASTVSTAPPEIKQPAQATPATIATPENSKSASAQSPAQAQPAVVAVAMAAAPVAPAPAEVSPAPANVAAAIPAVETTKAEAETPAKPAAIKATALVASTNLSSYTVGSGDTLYSISRRFNLSVAELKGLNNLSEDTVKLGQTLKVRGNPAMVASSAQDDAVVQVSTLKNTTQAKAAAEAVPVEYVVKKGDTLFSIARKFGVRHTDIQNEAGPTRVHRLTPGQRLVIQGL